MDAGKSTIWATSAHLVMTNELINKGWPPKVKVSSIRKLLEDKSHACDQPYVIDRVIGHISVTS